MRSNKQGAMKAATTACMPRLTRRVRASTARPAASVPLLERIRDVVLRLIMLTAVSKHASVHRSGSSGGKEEAAGSMTTCRREESIRNEAVEECIEFLKRSSAEGDTVKLSSVTADTVAAAVSVAVEEPETDKAVVVESLETQQNAAVAHSATPAI
ncbi:hypothetical protein BRADI_3g22670v3 [Brachypodium distachyon]|uniref:Uncharacterized protein n=1 Tax=Brachypodium distachyon TaxID=15368 RepID=A0A0Q3Q3Y3_BRADI|nr:hypothetical protein BRADI_3g22670v3 [Brachypodium distachyon]